MMDGHSGWTRAFVRGGAAAGGLAVLLALGGCEEEQDTSATVRVVVLLPDGVDPLAGVGRLVFRFEKDPVETFTESLSGDAGGMLEYTFTFVGVEASAVIDVRGEDTSGILRAHGRTVPVRIAPGFRDEVGVVMLTPGTFAPAPEDLRLSLARTLHGSSRVGDRWLLVAGGTTAAGVTPIMELFDVGAWQPVADVPAMPSARSRFGLVPLDSHFMLFVGGVQASVQADVFNAATRAWTVVPMPSGAPEVWMAPRFASFNDGTAFVGSGFDGTETAVAVGGMAAGNGFTLFDWTTTRTDPTLTPVETPNGPRVLIYGGQAPGEFAAVLLDPATGTDETPPFVPEEVRSRHTAVRVGPSRVVIAGGRGPTGDPAYNVIIFDGSCIGASPPCDVFSDAGPALRSLGGMADATGVGINPDGDDPRAIFVGGVDDSDSPIREALILDSRSGTAMRKPLRTPRSGCTVERLPAGQIAVIGGLDGAGVPLDTIELLDAGDP